MDSLDTNFSPEPSTTVKGVKTSKVILIALSILVFLSITSLAAISFFPEFILSPKAMFLKATGNSNGKFIKEINDYFNNDFVKDTMKVYEEPVNAKSEVDLKINSNAIMQNAPARVVSLNALLDLLSSSKIVMDESLDFKNEKDTSSISLFVKDNKFIEMKTFLDKQRFGISVPEIYGKYIIADKNNLTAVWEKFAIPEGPSKIVTSLDIMKAIKVSKKDYTDIINDYSQFIANNIDGKDITFSKNSKINTSDGDINCKQLTLKLDEAKLKDLTVKVLEKVSKDDKLLNLTVGNYVNVMKLYEDAGYFKGSNGIEELNELKDMNKVKQKIVKFIEEVKQQETKNKLSVNVTLLVDNGFNVLQKMVEVADNTDPQKPQILSKLLYADYKNPKTKLNNTIIDFKAVNTENAEQSIAVSYKNNEQPEVKGKGKNSKVTLDIASSEYGKTTDILKAKFDAYSTEIKGKQQTVEANFDMTVGGLPGNITGKLTLNDTRDPKNKTMDAKFILDTTVKLNEGINQEFGINISTDTQYKFGQPVQMPEINSANSIDLNTVSMQQMQSEFESMQNGAMTFLMKNQELFKSVFGGMFEN